MRVTTVSQTGVGASSWLPIDAYTDGYGQGLFLKIGAGATVSIEITADNIFDPTVTPIAFPCGVAALTGATTNIAAQQVIPARAVRINQSVGVTTSTLQVVERGLTG